MNYNTISGMFYHVVNTFPDNELYYYKKDGDWIEKILERYLFIDADYILIDDITFDEKMTLWWRKFCSKHSNALNIVDYLGREVRNSKFSDNNLNCGFGLISKNDFQL